jgi:hypothetical protein
MGETTLFSTASQAEAAKAEAEAAMQESKGEKCNGRAELPWEKSKNSF